MSSERTENAPSPQSQNDADLPPVKFLLVDDLEDNLLAMEAFLARDGLQIFSARSGFEALELMLVHDFALAMLDIHMPEMDGFELAELMRGNERTKKIPIIFVTAGTRDQHRTFSGYERGAVDFIYKPVEPYILRYKAETFFDLARSRQKIIAMQTIVRERLYAPLQSMQASENLDPQVRAQLVELESAAKDLL